MAEDLDIKSEQEKPEMNQVKNQIKEKEEKSGNSPFLSIIIPAYNEEKRIGHSLGKIIAYLQQKNLKAEIIVIDDGSTDQTPIISREILANHPLSRVISFPENRGKGAAVKEGMLRANGNFILYTDADLSTPLDEVEKFLPILQKDYDLAIASRALPESEIRKRQSWLRENFGKTFNCLVRLFFPELKDIKDTQCGFKLLKQTAAREIFSRLQTSGFAFDVEVLLLARKLDYKVAQVPVIWINSPDSRVHLFRTSLQMFAELLKIKKRFSKCGSSLNF